MKQKVVNQNLEAFLDPTRRTLENTPVDDEPWTSEDERALTEAEAAIRHGRVKKHSAKTR